MNKQAISVTLGSENLLWLRGQAHAAGAGAGAGSISAALDRLVSSARAGGQVHESTIRSVVGTVSIADFDSELLEADAAVHALFPGLRVAEPATRYSRAGKSPKSPPPGSTPKAARPRRQRTPRGRR